jgi:hypothetical protein
MRALIFGALLGLLLLFPSLFGFVASVAVVVVCKPLVVAFALGLVARPHLHRLRRWSR